MRSYPIALTPEHVAQVHRVVVEAELKPALDTITAQASRGWISYAGYALP
jgi:hypothetical protein